MPGIKEYDFTKRQEPSIEIEIFKLEDFFKRMGKSCEQPHKIDYFQILFIIDGTGHHMVDFTQLPYTKGCIIPVCRHQVQMFSVNRETKGYMLLFTPAFIYDGGHNHQLFADLLIFNRQISPTQFKGDRAETVELEHLLCQLLMDFETSMDFAKEEILRSVLKTFLLKAERIKRKQSSINHDSNLLLFNAFKELINEKLTHKLGVSDFSKALAISSKKLIKTVRTCTGKTPKYIIDERIILEIKRLLSFTNLSVKEIAFLTGFDEPTNMIKFFKKFTQLTPQSFRKTFHP